MLIATLVLYIFENGFLLPGQVVKVVVFDCSHPFLWDAHQYNNAIPSESHYHTGHCPWDTFVLGTSFVASSFDIFPCPPQPSHFVSWACNWSLLWLPDYDHPSVVSSSQLLKEARILTSLFEMVSSGCGIFLIKLLINPLWLPMVYCSHQRLKEWILIVRI